MTEQDNEKLTTEEQRYQFFFETPLYEVFSVDDPDQFLAGEVNGYNSIKKCETTFKINLTRVDQYSWDPFRKIALTCKRYENSFKFFVIVAEDAVLKIGQYPSLADIQFEKLGKKYDKLLDEKDLKNFKKAIGLAAHGVGAGSIVYLRKIFEDLINETFNNHSKELGTTPSDFRVKRMEDKVETIKKYLPQQVIKMKPLYSILSSGVHQLEEEDCLLYFSPLKLSIELILDEKIEATVLNARNEEVEKNLQQIETQLKGKF